MARKKEQDMRTPRERGYYTAEDIADEWGVSRRTVQNLLQEGKIKGVKFGKQWRVKPEAMDVFIEQGGTAGEGEV